LFGHDNKIKKLSDIISSMMGVTCTLNFTTNNLDIGEHDNKIKKQGQRKAWHIPSPKNLTQ